MKKGLLTIVLSLFILIPISINAEITCTYNPVNELGDNFGEINITRKNDGSFLINDIPFNNSSISLNRKLNGTDLYFAGSDARLMYSHVADSVVNYCESFKKKECPESVNIPGTFYNIDCDKKAVKCRKGSDAGVNGNLNVLNYVFSGNTCPTLNFAVDYDKKDAKKFYLILLSNDELVGINTAAKAKGTPKEATIEYNIDTVYYSAGTRIDHNYFDQVTYNKDSGNLKFKFTQYYGGSTFQLDLSREQSTTQPVANSVKFLDADYNNIKFQAYGNIKTKLDNWKIDDYLFIVFSDGQMGVLNHYLIASSADMISMCEKEWNYEYNECKSLLDNAKNKADAVRNPGAAMDKFDIELVPLCAPNSGALTVFKIIGYALVVIKILVPLALMIFGSIDFFKVVVGNNPDDMSKAIKAFIQRAIIALLVFLAPSIIYYFVGIIGNSIDKDDGYFQNCNTCLLNPDDCPDRKTLHVTSE